VNSTFSFPGKKELHLIWRLFQQIDQKIMRKIFLSIILICPFLVLRAQTFSLTVTNGYGSGNYLAGDTVHIWSMAYDSTKTFTEWTGDTQYLERPKEWHTTLIMPNQNVNVTSVIATIPSYNINYEQIMGANNLKNVYYCFPANLNAVVYLFHGTGGSAANWMNAVEYRSFVNAAIANDLGIIVTEAEEITLNFDLNSDGKLRWLTFPIDTVNGIDYLNIKAITDTLIYRGEFTHSTPKFSVGMSNGGSFSAAISYAYNYEAGISYCAASNQAIFNLRNNPFAFRMALYDNHEEVGPQGNYEAWQHDSILETRSICHNYQIHDRQPLYPERFARIDGISVASSQAIFNDLFNNNQLDNNNYALNSDTIMNNIISNPADYPNIIALPISLRKEALNQIAASNAEHKFYSDYNSSTLEFIDQLCSTTAGIAESTDNQQFSIYPNPANTLVYIQTDKEISHIQIFNLYGQLIKTTQTKNIQIDELISGLYFIKVTLRNGNEWTSKLVIKQ
jgi:hypothetical protein